MSKNNLINGSRVELAVGVECIVCHNSLYRVVTRDYQLSYFDSLDNYRDDLTHYMYSSCNIIAISNN